MKLAWFLYKILLTLIVTAMFPFAAIMFPIGWLLTLSFNPNQFAIYPFTYWSAHADIYRRIWDVEEMLLIREVIK